MPLYTYHYSLFSDLTFFWLPTMVQTIQNPLERQPWFKKTLECHILFMYIDVCVYVMDLIVYNIILSIYIWYIIYMIYYIYDILYMIYYIYDILSIYIYICTIHPHPMWPHKAWQSTEWSRRGPGGWISAGTSASPGVPVCCGFWAKSGRKASRNVVIWSPIGLL